VSEADGVRKQLEWMEEMERIEQEIFPDARSRPGGSKRAKRTTPIANTTFDNWWSKSLTAAGVRKRNPHMTRHTCATRWRRRGLAMEEIQALLGHESISTTSDTYVQTNLDSIAAHMREAVGDPA
jgi:integrase